MCAGNGELVKMVGCQLLIAVQVHRQLQKAMHLFPENIFVGQSDIVPGVVRCESKFGRLCFINIKDLRKSLLCIGLTSHHT